MFPRPAVKLFVDAAHVPDMVAARASGIAEGFTTNPTLMRKSGVTDYASFAAQALRAADGLPISFEVLSDSFDEMERQAHRIASWGDTVYVKIPITNTQGASSVPLIRRLAAAGMKVNVTAILTNDQVRAVAEVLDPAVPAVVSVFAGRIADTGRDPIPLMRDALGILRDRPQAELLWASPREILNLVQAADCGCHIITVTPDILRKLPLLGKSLEAVSLETVEMFYTDAVAAAFTL